MKVAVSSLIVFIYCITNVIKCRGRSYIDSINWIKMIKMILKILQNSQNAETPVLEPRSNNAAGLQFLNFNKKRLQYRCFPANFANISIKPFWQGTSGWLLLVFTFEFWESFQNTFFIEQLWETAYFMHKLHDFSQHIQ